MRRLLLEKIVPNKKIKHCCELMAQFVYDPRVGVEYYSKCREYSIDIKFSSDQQEQLYFCPWCGSKLPSSLRDLYCEVLEKEYHIEYPFDEEETKDLPEEFKSDAWWKKRGF